ncbi:MAG: hypothetical protein M0Z55_00210 [Peptococcaceae bacterium]|nr:hypothetical protein [Peptococcaceae bacterium]
MVKVLAGDDLITRRLRAKVRLDYKSETKPNKFLFGGKNVEDAAEEVREQKVSLLRNVPIQGIGIEDIDMSVEIYVVKDDMSGHTVAYAPVLITVSADSIEDLSRFIIADEFRKIEILEPEQIFYDRQDLERFLFKISQEMRQYIGQIERRYTQK